MAALSEAAPAARGDVAAVRAWWRVARPGPGIGHRLDQAYTVAFAAAIVGAVAYGTASSVLASWITPAAAATWGASLVLAAMVMCVRWGAYQGPVVFNVPDVSILLGAPLPRRRLAVGRMIRSLAYGGLAGILIAAVVLVGLAGDGRGIAAARAAGLLVGPALSGVLAVAGAAAVQRSARAERLSRLARWPALAAAALLAVWASGSVTGEDVALWSGPWGWAARPAVGGPTSRWLLALALLAVVTVAAAVVALRSCGTVPTERHLRRAEARAGARASVMSFDARSARRAITAGASAAPVRRRRGVRRPRRYALAIPWRDAVAHLAAPQQLVEGTLLAGGGAALSLLGGGRSAAAVGALVGYLGAARMLEPLRAELDVPSRPRILLRDPLGRVLVLHTVVPLLVVAVAYAVVALGTGLAGALPTQAALRIVLLLASVPALVFCAALSARRGGRVPVGVMTTMMAGDPSGGSLGILAWLLLWPAAATITGGVPGLLIGHGASPTPALVIAAVAPYVLAKVLQSTK